MFLVSVNVCTRSIFYLWVKKVFKKTQVWTLTEDSDTIISKCCTQKINTRSKEVIGCWRGIYLVLLLIHQPKQGTSSLSSSLYLSLCLFLWDWWEKIIKKFVHLHCRLISRATGSLVGLWQGRWLCHSFLSLSFFFSGSQTAGLWPYSGTEVAVGDITGFNWGEEI